MEESLDDISAGNVPWRSVLGEFWQPFHTQVDGLMSLSITEVRNCFEGMVMNVGGRFATNCLQ